MSAILQFHVTHLDSLFRVIGSADQDLLLEIGVTLGSEFRTPDEDEEDEFFGDDKTEEPPEWDYDEEEADSAKEVVVKMVMNGISPDLAEDEAYALQDYFAAHAKRDNHVHLLEPDDIRKDLEKEFGEEVADEVQELLFAGVREEQMTGFADWAAARGASHDLVVHLQMLYLGRLPEVDEPTFHDIEDDAYSARFGYLHGSEAAQMTDELRELAPKAAEEHGAIGYLMAALMRYCSSHNRDLIVTIDD